MKNTTTIIGKNSLLFSSVKKDLKRNIHIIEYSHNEIWNLNSIENPVIFSFSKKNK